MTPDRLHEVLSKYAASKGQQLNRDKEFVLDILAGLLRNEERYGYRSCPCRLASGMKEKGCRHHLSLRIQRPGCTGIRKLFLRALCFEGMERGNDGTPC